MTNKSQTNLFSTILLELPWAKILGDAWKEFRKILRGFSHEGVYEVLDYRSALEILDETGKKARYIKEKKVRYLQDDVIAYQDHAWGDGKILLNYQCSPGKAVDKYRSGYKTYILISLREIKNRGDVDKFHIQWDMQNSFPKAEESWSTHITQRTKKITIEITFPKDRKPYHVVLEESNRRRTQYLSKDSFHNFQDGRVKVSYKIKHPRLYEHYVLRWHW
jgi:hypothetical protein